jgi:hypothetical protein
MARVQDKTVAVFPLSLPAKRGGINQPLYTTYPMLIISLLHVHVVHFSSCL